MGNGPRYPRALISSEAERLLWLLDGRATVCGSLRRGSATCGDVDLVLSESLRKDEAVDILVRKGGLFLEDVGDPRTELSVAVPWTGQRVKVDVWQGLPGRTGSCIFHATGSGMFNTILRRWAKHEGGILSWRGVFDRDGLQLDDGTEEGCLAALGLPWIPPEEREDAITLLRPLYELMNREEEDRRLAAVEDMVGQAMAENRSVATTRKILAPKPKT